MNVYRFLFCLLLAGTLLHTGQTQARLRHPATGEKIPHKPDRGLDFIENKGQWNKEARFKAQIPGGVFFLTDDAMVYHFINPEEWDRLHDTAFLNNPTGQQVHHHAYKVHFYGCNPNATYRKEEVRSYYHNYFKGRDTSRWKGHVNLSGKVIREQVYNGIDLAVYSTEHRLKYDFLVAAGADAGQIALLYEGVQPELTVEGNLLIRTSVNEITEQAPYCYQVVNGKKQTVPSAYRLDGRMLRIVFPEGYNASLPLVIDPEVVYATYSGAVIVPGTLLYAPMYAHTTTYDAQGQMYVGVTISEPGWPVGTGAFQTDYADYDDVGINVYSDDGSTLVYATYYGGELQELPLTMIVNAQGELIVAGTTNSEDDLPVTPGCFDNSFAGPLPIGLNPFSIGDMFIAHFNSTGTALLGATYLGGTGYEPIASTNAMNSMTASLLPVDVTMCPMEMTLDAQGNIWLIANTASADFPVTANAQQPALAGGVTDIVLCKISADCSQLLYSSFLGGSDADIGCGILRNNLGNLVICGGTKSNNFPVTPGALYTTARGDFDGFVSVINPATGAILQSTYMGTSSKDQTTMIQADEQGNIYTAGISMGNYPISAGTYAMNQGELFLDKLSPDLSSSLVSTRLGLPSLQLKPISMSFTDCNQLVFSTFSYLVQVVPTPMPVTPDAFASTKRRFWFCTLNDDFSALTYASYFGSDMSISPEGLLHTDGYLTGIHRYDPEGIIYQSLYSINGAFPTTPGSWAPVSNLLSSQQNNQNDAASFKIRFGINSNFSLVNGNDSGCAPYTVQLENNANGASTHIWDFGDGSPQSNLATPPPHTYTIPGTYTVTLIVTNDSTCTKADTAFMDITVLTVTQPDISLQDTILCNPIQAMDIGVQINNPNPNFAISWGPANGLLSPSNQQNITVNPFLSNIFYVTVTDDAGGICTATASDTIHIDMAPVNLDIITQDTTVCQGTVLPISATGNPNYSFRWVPGTGMNDSTILEPVITVNQPEVYVLTATYPGCPDTSLLLSIDMEITPQVALGPDKIICQWLPVALESLITPFNNSYQFQWSPATADLSSPNEPNTYFIADSSVGYTLTVQTPFGCLGKDSIYVTVIPGAFGGITADTGYCPGDSVLLLATGGNIYSWTPAYGLNDTAIAGPVAAPLTTTDYTVYITNQYGCADTERVNIQVYPDAVLAIPDSITVYPGEQYHLEPGTNCLYFSWFPPSGINSTQVSDPLFNPEVRTRYFVTATTEHGCRIRDSIDVLVKETVMDMPNAFVPSGTNSLFRPSIRGIAQLKEFSIFNRWGNKVYSSHNIQEGWDGTYNGKPQPVGVYVYSIDAVMDNGRTFQKRGNVTLVR